MTKSLLILVLLALASFSLFGIWRKLRDGTLIWTRSDRISSQRGMVPARFWVSLLFHGAMAAVFLTLALWVSIAGTAG